MYEYTATRQGQTKKIILEDDERQVCEIWTRVMGYHRPVTSFNIGKKSEYKDRVTFREPSESDIRRGDC